MKAGLILEKFLLILASHSSYSCGLWEASLQDGATEQNREEELGLTEPGPYLPRPGPRHSTSGLGEGGSEGIQPLLRFNSDWSNGQRKRYSRGHRTTPAPPPLGPAQVRVECYILGELVNNLPLKTEMFHCLDYL